MPQPLIGGSRAKLIETEHRAPDHPTWTAGVGWNVFLGHSTKVRRVIRYAEENPIKIGLPAQTWPFMKPYDDWPLCIGHSRNSPYAKRLRVPGRYP